jgi:transposase
LFDKQGVDAFKPKAKGAPSMKKYLKKKELVEGSQEAFIAEIEFLQMENAYLNKLNALVQMERKYPSIKKQK